MAKTEGQLAADLHSVFAGEPSEPDAPRAETIVVDEQSGQVAPTITIARPRTRLFNPADTRTQMAESHAALKLFITDVMHPTVEAKQQPDMEIVEL